MSKRQLFYLIVILQIVFLLSMIVFKQATLMFGAVVLLKPVPVDPTDMIRGDFINLRYEISTIPASETKGMGELLAGDHIYVGLKNVGEYWDIREVSTGKVNEPYVKGRIEEVYKQRTYGITEETTGKRYEYEERVYDYYSPPERNIKKGDTVEFSAFDSDNVAYVQLCPGGECPNAADKYNAMKKGVVVDITDAETEYSVAYPIQSYFIKKGTGDKEELQDMNNMLVEAKVWRGDAVVTKLLYKGMPLDFR